MSFWKKLRITVWFKREAILHILKKKVSLEKKNDHCLVMYCVCPFSLAKDANLTISVSSFSWCSYHLNVTTGSSVCVSTHCTVQDILFLKHILVQSVVSQGTALTAYWGLEKGLFL